MKLPKGKKIYFSSDNHLGAPNAESSIARERIFISWLNHIQKDVEVLFLLGDLFDFWFEYKTVVPKGFVRVLGKLAELSDQGVEIHFFAGNHDLWVRRLFSERNSVLLYIMNRRSLCLIGKKFFIGHGDGLGPKDLGFKRMKKVFTAPFFQWLYRWIHPDIGMRIGPVFVSKKQNDFW